MKKFWKEFFLRGLIAAGGGPIVLAIIYGFLGVTGAVHSLSPNAVCMGIISITVLAMFIGGMTAIYQMEQLPLPSAILIHGAGLYAAYILTYLLNGWLKHQWTPVLIFTACFVAGYAIIWLIIYSITKAKTEQLNKNLRQNQ